MVLVFDELDYTSCSEQVMVLSHDGSPVPPSCTNHSLPLYKRGDVANAGIMQWPLRIPIIELVIIKEEPRLQLHIRNTYDWSYISTGDNLTIVFSAVSKRRAVPFRLRYFTVPTDYIIGRLPQGLNAWGLPIIWFMWMVIVKRYY